jgi:hypothetical protein
MKINHFKTLIIIFFAILTSCSLNKTTNETPKIETQINKEQQVEKKYHNYGGWYCPDNLNGFPAVNIENWNTVTVVKNRLPNQEETRNGASLIYVDTLEYPNAKPLDIELPKLARFYNESSKKEELVIVIQAINVLDDSIVGFRYLNGGNGSAWLNEVTFLNEADINKLTPAKFVTLSISIDATQDSIWKVLTKPEYYKTLQPIFDQDNKLTNLLTRTSSINFKYPEAGILTAEYADDLFGNKYAQIDYELDDYQYVEKFLLLENPKTKTTELKIICGPYQSDYKTQKIIIDTWAKKVKELSEK